MESDWYNGMYQNELSDKRHHLIHFLKAGLISTAAAGLLAFPGVLDYPIPRSFCLASIICGLGSAIASTTLLSCFPRDRSVRLAWFKGAKWFVMALSAPGGWLRWGIATLQMAFLTSVGMTQPLPVKIVLVALVASQLLVLLALPVPGWLYRSNIRASYRRRFFSRVMPFSPQVSFDEKKGMICDDLESGFLM